MTNTPQVSVVMSVYNGATTLLDSVQSVLCQDGVDFEFIIIDDGSTDDSERLLQELASQDRRIRFIHQDNRGLTRALIRGCAEAKGTFIARQDCGDLSLSGRLSREMQVIEASHAALVSTSARFLGPEGELLYEASIPEGDATDALLTIEPERVRGPAHHGSTMFRRALYERVGGYRQQFYFAQDLDLWTRLAELGRHVVIPEVLYEAKFALGSISGMQRARQIALTHIILECARLRRSGMSEAGALAQAANVVPGGKRAADLAAALYFVGACLHKRGDRRARKYFWNALRKYPLHFKSAWRLLVG